MKALLLAAACSLLYVLLISLLFRVREIRQRAEAMLYLFLATVPLYLAAYALWPADLGFLPASLVEPRATLAGAFGLVVHGALFFGGWLQLYNVAERGFSLRILIDIDESAAGTLSAAELETRYGGGRGLRWMQDKRIEGIVESALVTLHDGRLRTTPRGARTARVFGGLRRFLRIETAQ